MEGGRGRGKENKMYMLCVTGFISTAFLFLVTVALYCSLIQDNATIMYTICTCSG